MKGANKLLVQLRQSMNEIVQERLNEEMNNKNDAQMNYKYYNESNRKISTTNHGEEQ